jgi:hypothetical protein
MISAYKVFQDVLILETSGKGDPHEWRKRTFNDFGHDC